MVLDTSWYTAIGMFSGTFALIPLTCYMIPGPYAPGSPMLITMSVVFALLVFGILAALIYYSIDPFPYGILYSFALMVISVEVWFREDPELFNGSRFKGFPLFIFHYPPGGPKIGTMAPVPMAPYTRVFATWHAGGTILCFFMHVLGHDFPIEAKAQTSLALGLLWVTWAANNYKRCVYGTSEFCQTGAIFHTLVGPGCGLCGYWMVTYWYRNRTQGTWTVSESVVLGTFFLYALGTVISFVVDRTKQPSKTESEVENKAESKIESKTKTETKTETWQDDV